MQKDKHSAVDLEILALSKDQERRKAQCKTAKETAEKQGQSLCNSCQFTGIMLMQCVETGASFAFRCSRCAAAEQMGYTESFPSWTEHYHERFKPFQGPEGT